MYNQIQLWVVLSWSVILLQGDNDVRRDILRYNIIEILTLYWHLNFKSHLGFHLETILLSSCYQVFSFHYPSNYFLLFIIISGAKYLFAIYWNASISKEILLSLRQSFYELVQIKWNSLAKFLSCSVVYLYIFQPDARYSLSKLSSTIGKLVNEDISFNAWKTLKIQKLHSAI